MVWKDTNVLLMLWLLFSKTRTTLALSCSSGMFFFIPPDVEDLSKHKMDSEELKINQSNPVDNSGYPFGAVESNDGI